MPDETLNIEYHTRRLVVKALNVKPSHLLAANALGVHYRTLLNRMRQYNIKKVKGEYMIIDTKFSNIKK